MHHGKTKQQTNAAIEAELIKVVRKHKGISRVALARELHIVPSTAGIHVDRLLDRGFLGEEAPTTRRFGRPPTLLTLNPDAGRFVGLDFEARNLMAMAVDFSQRPLRQVHQTIRSSDSLPQILRKLETAIHDVMAGDPRPVLGLGVGLPGVIDPHSGVAVHYAAIKGWQRIPLGARLNRKFGAPVFLENNIRSMALAELWFGQGRGLQDFVCVGVRSGIAAGIVAHGQLLHGQAYQAGEVGRCLCPPPTEFAPDAASRRIARYLCEVAPQAPGGSPGQPLGNPGFRFEAVASVSAILRAAARAVAAGERTSLREAAGEIGIDHVLAAARHGDPLARCLVEAVAREHGWLVGQLNAAFNPQAVIFAGPLTELGEIFLAPIEATARQCAGVDLNLRITGSALGRYNGALGAAALALHVWEPNHES